MRKICAILLIVITIMSTQACSGLPSSHPIEDFQNILVAGIDIERENIILTIVVDTMEEGSKPGEEKSGTKIYMSKGQTMFDAKRKLHEFSEEHVAWHHLHYIIIGEDAAKQGVDRLLGFFCENEENNLTHEVLIAKKETANSFIQHINTEDANLFDLLNTLKQEVVHTGKSKSYSLLDYAINSERTWESLLIPTVELYENPLIEAREDEQHQVLRQYGYALFDEDMLVGYLDDDAARGLNYIINEMESTAIIIKDRSGQNVSLEVIGCEAKIETDPDTFSAAIKIDVKSNLVEYFETESIFDQDYLHDLMKKQNEVIKKEAQQAILIAQQLHTDVMGIGDAFFHDDAQKWKEIKDEWKDIFSDLDISVCVTSSIQCSYNFQNAVGK